MEKVIVIPGFEIMPNIPIPYLRGRVVSGEELGFISATADFRSYHCLSTLAKQKQRLHGQLT